MGKLAPDISISEGHSEEAERETSVIIAPKSPESSREAGGRAPKKPETVKSDAKKEA
jgi:hypothetical protein